MSTIPDPEGRAKAPAEPDHLRRTTMVLMAVAAERGRQEMLLAAGKFPWNCATLCAPGSECYIDDSKRLAVLMEEVGEVAKEINEEPQWDFDDEAFQKASLAYRLRLRTELVQVAACATAFIEAIDQQIELASGIRPQASGTGEGGRP